jgi:flavin-dependent dehydrogenase
MAAFHPAHSRIDATISPREAGGISWQAVVVGAGPAGAATAIRLAASGLRTLLVERHHFPRDKVCGCCLSSRALGELERLGPSALPEAAVPLGAVRLAHRGRSARLPLPAGRVVSRSALDTALVRQAIAAGAHWLPGARVTAIDDGLERPGAVATLFLQHEAATSAEPQPIAAELVVLAAGLVDHVRVRGPEPSGRAATHRIARGSRIGVGGIVLDATCGLPAGELVMAVGRHGYCGVVRLEDGRIDVAAAIDRAALATHADPARAIAAILAETTGLPDGHLPESTVIQAAAFHVTPALTRSAPLVAGGSGRILRIGDAAGYVEPFTGEGIGWALSSGRILADAILAPTGILPPIVASARYRAAHRREFGPVHARCRFVAAILRRPAVVAAAVASANALPWAARCIVPSVVGARPARRRVAEACVLR